jgi:hypothetical protein
LCNTAETVIYLATELATKIDIDCSAGEYSASKPCSSGPFFFDKVDQIFDVFCRLRASLRYLLHHRDSLLTLWSEYIQEDRPGSAMD